MPHKQLSYVKNVEAFFHRLYKPEKSENNVFWFK